MTYLFNNHRLLSLVAIIENHLLHISIIHTAKSDKMKIKHHLLVYYILILRKEAGKNNSKDKLEDIF